jgi:hypothetical protein
VDLRPFVFLELWVRIPLAIWIFVSWDCCVMSGRGICDELVTRLEESYRLCCVVVCDLEASRMRRPWKACNFPWWTFCTLTLVLSAVAYVCSAQYGASFISAISRFPGMMFGCCLNDLEMVPIALFYYYYIDITRILFLLMTNILLSIYKRHCSQRGFRKYFSAYTGTVICLNTHN